MFLPHPSVNTSFIHPMDEVGNGGNIVHLQTCIPRLPLQAFRARWTLQSLDPRSTPRPLSSVAASVQDSHLCPPRPWSHCSPLHLLEWAPWCPVLSSISHHWGGWLLQASYAEPPLEPPHRRKDETPSCLPPGGEGCVQKARLRPALKRRNEQRRPGASWQHPRLGSHPLSDSLQLPLYLCQLQKLVNYSFA